MQGVEAFLEKEPQDLLLVHGDTTTTMAAALAGFYQKTPVGHVEAGLRSHTMDSPFPEEANRVITDRLSSLHFAPTMLAAQNLQKEGINGASVHVTGNTVIDALFWTLGRERKEGDLPDIPTDATMVLVTAHRRESWGVPMEEICSAVRALSEKYLTLRFLIPLHKNPAVRNTITVALQGLPNAIFTEPLAYPTFVEAMNRSLFIMSDSGGVQEEATALKKPLLILRELSERPEAVESGTGVLVGTSRKRIEEEAFRLLEDSDYRASFRKRDTGTFGDGKASERIVSAIKNFFGSLRYRIDTDYNN
jgi:UDP-N-acetylglucosamine 2-epimerase (non-hydrolysing)